MNVAPVVSPLHGEHLNFATPVMRPEIDAGWRRHLNYWTGRALTADALETEQLNRAARLAWRGRLVAPGVVTGLECGLSIEEPRKDAPKTRLLGYSLHVAPGHGIALSGEDVIVPQPLTLPLDQIPVAFLREEDPLPPPVNVGPPGEDDKPWFLEYDVQGVGFREHQFSEDFIEKKFPPVGVLILRPAATQLIAQRDSDDACEYDPTFDAFSDPRRVDASHLMIYGFSEEWLKEKKLDNFLGEKSWRNRLAYALFDIQFEQAAAQKLIDPSQAKRWATEDKDFVPTPWELLGVPLALVSFEKTEAKPGFRIFLDPAAVVRPGGVPRNRPRPAAMLGLTRKLPPFPGTPPLWRARIDQFSEHVISLDSENEPPDALAAHFAFLPPAGRLPRSILEIQTTKEAGNAPDRAARSHFFPPYYAVEAVPIPTEQLDAAFAASAPLAPFDFKSRRPDLVRVLVPLPQRLFDPKLLVIEKEDPFFALEANRLAVLRQGWRQRRDFVRLRQDDATKIINGAKVNRDPGVFDADQVEAEPTAKLNLDPVLIPPPGSLGPWQIEIIPGPTKASAATPFYISLHLDEEAPPSRIEVTLTAADKSTLVYAWDNPPPIKLISNPDEPVEAKALWRRYETFFPELGKEARELLTITIVLRDGRAALGEIGFIFRDQKDHPWWIPGQGKVTSPQGVWLSLTDSVGIPPINIDHLLAPFEDAYQPAAFPDGKTFEDEKNEILTASGKQAVYDESGLEGVVAQLQREINSGDDFVDFGFLKTHANLYRVRRILFGETKADEMLNSESLASLIKQESGPVSEKALTERFADVILKRNPVQPASAGGGGTAPGAPRATSIGSRVFRTLSSATMGVAEGVTGAVTNQIMAGQQLIGQGFPLRTLNLTQRFETERTQSAFDNAYFHFRDLLTTAKDLNLGIDTDEKIPGVFKGNKEVSFGDFFKDKVKFSDLKFGDLPDNRDTAGNLSWSLFASDATVLFLRRLEYYIARKKLLLARAQALLESIRALARTIAARLVVLEGKLAEARHDVSVARALWKEEQQRVADINQRRDDLIRDEVTFLAFVRPREIDLARRDMPSYPLDPFDAPAPVPVCLKQHDEPPGPLRDYVQLFHHAPVGWFPELRGPIRLFDKREAMLELVQTAHRSALQFFGDRQVTQANYSVQALRSTYQGAFSLVEAQRRITAGLQFIADPVLTWDDHRRDAEQHVTVGDLIDGRHGKIAASRAAAHLLEQIEAIATCLHAEFAAVAPATRLRWVERYSQFDKPSPLRDLSVLPGYAALTRDARRRFQSFVDWLFQRVNQTDRGAFALINDLVRLCLLLASHAPVNQIITGHIPRPTPVRPGIRIPIRAIDATLVRIGMPFHVWQGPKLVAHGLVEDLRESEVSARINQTQIATLDSTMRVQFMPPGNERTGILKM